MTHVPKVLPPSATRTGGNGTTRRLAAKRRGGRRAPRRRANRSGTRGARTAGRAAQEEDSGGAGRRGRAQSDECELLGVGRVWLVRGRALALCVFLRQKHRSGDPREAPNAHAAREDENQERD